MRTGWRSTLHGEWIRDGVGIVTRVDDRGWFAYPFGPMGPLGPFASLAAAQEAIEAVITASDLRTSDS